MPEFEFAVPTAATIGEYVLQTCTWFETNSDFCATLWLFWLFAVPCLFTSFFALMQIRPTLVRLVGLNSVEVGTWTKLLDSTFVQRDHFPLFGLSRYLDRSWLKSSQKVKSPVVLLRSGSFAVCTLQALMHRLLIWLQILYGLHYCHFLSFPILIYGTRTHELSLPEAKVP